MSDPRGSFRGQEVGQSESAAKERATDGQEVAARDTVAESAAPTAHGLVSYAVRWHGDRVALLWEVEPNEGHGPVRLTAPGLEPGWSTTERRGEALLGPVPGDAAPARPAAPVGAPGPAPGQGDSFG